MKLLPCPLCGTAFLISQEPFDNGRVAGLFYIYHAYRPLGSAANECRLTVNGHFESEADACAAWNLRTPQSWQPISTAPTDGTPIIGTFMNMPWADDHMNGRIVKCWYQPEFSAFISSCRQMSGAPGYTFENGKSELLHSPDIEPVTHWIAVPEKTKETTDA